MSKQIPIRLDTEVTKKRTEAVDHKRQNMIGILGIKGEGKSNLLEAEATVEFDLGYLGVDLHAPLLGNMENAFWCIPKLGMKTIITDKGKKKQVFDKQLSHIEIEQFQQDPVKFMKERKCYKETLFASESIRYDQNKLDRFNDRLYTQDDWYAESPSRIIKETWGCVSIYNKVAMHFDMFNPPLKPKEKWGKEMVRVVKLPFVNTKDGSEPNKKAKEIIFREFLSARKERRMIVMNRAMFANEKQYFWTMELIIRSLREFYDLYCPVQYPHQHGYTEDNFPNHLKNHHRIFILTRELGELAPAKLKIDRSGESTTVKRSLLELGRTCRHTQIDWFADWQRYNDVDPQVRGQFDDLFFKKYNEELAGEKEKFFTRLDEERQANVDRHGYKKGNLLNKSYYPDAHRLAKKYFYGFYDSHDPQLFEVPNTHHQHKEPEMKFHEMTGIYFDHDEEKIPLSAKGSATKQVDSSDQKTFYTTYMMLRQPNKSGKKIKRDDVKTKLVELQKQGKLPYPPNVDTKSNDWLQSTAKKIGEKMDKLTK